MQRQKVQSPESHTRSDVVQLNNLVTEHYGIAVDKIAQGGHLGDFG